MQCCYSAYLCRTPSFYWPRYWLVGLLITKHPSWLRVNRGKGIQQYWAKSGNRLIDGLPKSRRSLGKCPASPKCSRFSLLNHPFPIRIPTGSGNSKKPVRLSGLQSFYRGLLYRLQKQRYGRFAGKGIHKQAAL